jgi:hypothetical protein
MSRARDHDGVQDRRLDHDRHGGGGLADAGREIEQDEAEAGEEHEKLEGRENSLYERPSRGVSPPLLLRGVERLGYTGAC